jgi:hypothetical protein
MGTKQMENTDQANREGDRRCSPRFAFQRVASVLCENAEYAGTLLNVSLRGALFEAIGYMPGLSGSFTLVIPFSRDPEEAIRIVGDTAFRRVHRVGVQWDKIDVESTMKLRRLVELNLGTPKLLEHPVLSLIWPRVPAA